ncbi:MAG TPA: glycosyltransferase family 2 protein [Ignavibacteria bacterium]|nr:glycosyltransferase family 2 protein [Ignavibacteria bacterium]
MEISKDLKTGNLAHTFINKNGFPSRITPKVIPPATVSGKPWPKISIVTVSYNMVDYIEDTILSVISQQYPNLEYIIIDGGSKDGTVDIIKKYENWITYWISEPDNGMYDAIQKGFKKATGDIMAYLNSDDKYHYNAFYSVGTIFTSHEDVQWILGRASFYNDEGTIVDVKDLKRWSKFNYYTGDYKWIQQESVFWKRELWIKAGSKIDTNLKYAGDYELWLRFFRFAKLYSCETIFAGFRFRTKDQLSLEKLDSYLYEVDQVTNLSSLPREDKYSIKKINFFRNFILKIPFIRRIKYLTRKYEKTFDYPPKIVYDFMQRQFFKNLS